MGWLGQLFGKKYATIDAAEARSLVDAGALLIDVRSGAEWKREHPSAATHIPLESVGRRATELDAGRPIVTICHSGARSAIAARTLARHGFTVSSVRGGIGAWKRAGGRIASGGMGRAAE